MKKKKQDIRVTRPATSPEILGKGDANTSPFAKGKGRTDCGTPGVHYRKEFSHPVRDKVTGGVISLKQVQKSLKEVLRRNYSKMRKEMQAAQLFMPGPPEFEVEMEIDLGCSSQETPTITLNLTLSLSLSLSLNITLFDRSFAGPLCDETGFNDLELYTLVQDFLKVAKTVKLADPDRQSKGGPALASSVIDFQGFKVIMAKHLYTLPQVLHRIWKVMDMRGEEGDIKLFDNKGREVDVMTFAEIATGLMYFKETEKTVEMLPDFLASETFKEVVTTMFANNDDNDVISKLCLYALLDRFPRSEQYELSDAIFETISEDGTSLYANEFNSRFDVCAEMYPNNFKRLMYYIILMQGAEDDSPQFEKCREMIFALTEKWRKNKADFRFIYLDRLVGAFKKATDVSVGHE